VSGQILNDCLGFKRGCYPTIWYAYDPVLHLNALDLRKNNICILTQYLLQHKTQLKGMKLSDTIQTNYEQTGSTW